ncbi:hypothetical protein [Tuwongella immobilis]|uniref:Lipoprotein n=1 Tax=Tuwongella immobilis TaxID=692036 RepID=A0A6C2YLE0_9BACT|nr:hypothetical protein [Tuwongella immobilis]VIP02194.1 Uncharacterized protein OS=Singulisphaera acidiphila (strain ATCC BAA-1392 / DSM 18658 / VKM B-2454 / MOB10) GN=Sinac_7355 PE=4 SV=1 [Tuwongella immobilis]VTS00669.1 Uncharacterized protein OS=Singulisphaera acidiphila (strain ATCC BAA-1392 / DSM 18658 / VKM B-2454 / MOB10) GN=Sinac_7355 PE=4 SV=1 [Tuwongella immobilis]
MRNRRWLWIIGVLTCGCMSGPQVDNPVMVRSEYGPAVENPVLIYPGSPGPNTYAAVWEHVLDVVDDHFQIAYSNRFEGRILTVPKVAPGLAQPWRSSSPSVRERLLATLQSMRHRGEVTIQVAPTGGYLVQVVIYRELEDVLVPTTPSNSLAVFREASTVERQYQVVTSEVESTRWIPKGRDYAFEQQILRHLRECQPIRHE